MRGIPLIRARRALAVAEEEPVLRLRAGAVGSSLRVTAEARERVGAARATRMDATQARSAIGRSPARRPVAPAVLGTERVPEELVPDDEESVDPDRAVVEGGFRERGVLDQLAGVASVEHAVEVLAT